MTYNESITILHIKHGASKKEVKSAYHKLAHIHHPDKGGDAKKFIEVKRAYDFLMVNDPPSTNGFYSKSAGYGYEARRWYNPFTQEYEDMPPTTGKTTTRSKAETDTRGSDYWGKKMVKEQAILVKKQKIAQLKLELKKEEFQLSMLEFELYNY